MEQNRNIHNAGASTNERAPLINDQAEPLPHDPRDPPDGEAWDFGSGEEEDAYWAGFIDGTRNSGGRIEPRLAARARSAYPEVLLDPENAHKARTAEWDFSPAALRRRADGWTPEKQREYVEALADTGVARVAAERVGMSEQSANRLRRRADARGFDLACEAARRHGARRLQSIAYQRAIEGTVKKRYYKGEVIAEERVYDNRLLTFLLARAEPYLQVDIQGEQVADRWEPWMDALEQGAPPPELPPISSPEEAHHAAVAAALGIDRDALHRARMDMENDDFEDEEDDLEGELWFEEGLWWTSLPPPPGFTGGEIGEFGKPGYSRRLTEGELKVVTRHDEEDLAEARAKGEARRREVFGPDAEEDAACEPPAEEAARVSAGDVPELYEPSAETSEDSLPANPSAPSAGDGISGADAGDPEPGERPSSG